LKITVIGLGKLGLPLAVQFASKNNSVVGLDIDFDRVNDINLGQTPIAEEFDLDRKLKKVLSSGNLKATTDPIMAISGAEVIIVSVPLVTNSGGEPDFSIIDSVTESIGNFITKGTLVCYETTVPIGTTRNRFGKRIHELSNLEVGKEIYIVFSPERVLTGRVFSDLKKYPKIVGGVTENCTLQGLKFYQSVLDFDKRKDLKTENGVWKLENTEAAEFVKLAETTYRDVNIGLANLFAKHAQELGLNIKEIIEASNSQLYSHIHEPGISVGGHCIPIYPYLYLLGNNDAKLVKESRKINESMPAFFVKILLNAAGSLRDKKILILGATYRPGVKEVAYSGVFTLKEILIEHGALPFFLDPLLTEVELISMDLPPGNLDDEIDIVILHTGHESYNLSNLSQMKNLKFVIDGRNFFGRGFGLIAFKS
jgi:nucleotide sugar dehydrogenase